MRETNLSLSAWIQTTTPNDVCVMSVWLEKSFDQAINKHIAYKKNVSLCKTDKFSKRQLKSQNVCYKKKNFP